MFGFMFTLAIAAPACGSSTAPEIPPEEDVPDEPVPPGGDQDDK